MLCSENILAYVLSALVIASCEPSKGWLLTSIDRLRTPCSASRHRKAVMLAEASAEPISWFNARAS